MVRRNVSVAAIALAVVLLVSARQRAEDAIFKQIDGIVKTLSDVSGLAEEHPVPSASISKKQLRRFLSKRIRKTLRPEEIHADELALKLFGLVPQDFDLKKSTIDLLTEQAAAFYDYDAKKLFLLEGATIPDETTTLAHELAHALADQHFDLNKFMDESPANDDENLAHTAVVEGQASWLMLAYDLVQAGRPPGPTEEMLNGLSGATDTSAEDYPVLKASPLYIQQSLLFPYVEGTKFFDAVYRKMGKAAFAAVFTQAPVDSAQIIHPQRYFAHVLPKLPDLPKLQLAAEYKEVTEGSVGEFDHHVLLWRYLGLKKADALAPHLAGGRFQVSVLGKKQPPFLEYASLWDSAETAAEYFAAYKKILTAKWTHCNASTNTSSTFSGTSDSGYFVTRLNGSKMISVEGLSTPEDWKAAGAGMETREAPVTTLN